MRWTKPMSLKEQTQSGPEGYKLLLFCSLKWLTKPLGTSPCMDQLSMRLNPAANTSSGSTDSNWFIRCSGVPAAGCRKAFERGQKVSLSSLQVQNSDKNILFQSNKNTFYNSNCSIWAYKPQTARVTDTF